MPEEPKIIILLDSLWKYKVLISFTASLIISFHLLTNPTLREWLINLLRASPFIGSFVAGAFYAFFVTAPVATVVLFFLGKFINPFFVAIVGALGACFMDLFFFQFFQISIIPEIQLLASEIGKRNPRVRKLWESFRIAQRLKEPFFVQKIAPLLAAFIIASPIPDEVGVFLLSAVKYETKKFVPLSFFLNFIGIFVIVFLGYSIG